MKPLKISFEQLPKEKQTFIRYLDKIKIENNYSSNAKVLEKLNLYYDIPQGTFNDTVNSQKMNLNEKVVIAFCKSFNCDIFDIYRSKEPEKSETAKEDTMDRSAASAGTDADMIDPELPASFYDTFYGYFFNSIEGQHMEKGTIDMFTVNIQKDEISMLWSHKTPSVKQKNSVRISEFSLRGRVIHNQGGTAPDGMVVLSFNSEKGDFCTIAYSKFQIRGKLHFRRGALLIQRRGGENVPMIQSFILTDEKIDLEDADKKTILQGALTLTHEKFLIEKSKLDKYMNSELLTKYFDKISYNRVCREYVELDEDDIRKIHMDENELYQTLFNIKAESFHSQFYVFPKTDNSWHYIACLCDREEPLEE